MLTKNLEILESHIFLNLPKRPNSLQKETWNMWDAFKNFLPGKFSVLPDCWDIINLCSRSSVKVPGCTKHQFEFNVPATVIIDYSLSSCSSTGSLRLPNFLWNCWVSSKDSMQSLLFSYDLTWSYHVKIKMVVWVIKVTCNISVAVWYIIKHFPSSTGKKKSTKWHTLVQQQCISKQ